LTIIIPTQGRSTLPRALQSIRGQVAVDDVEVLVIADAYEMPLGTLHAIGGVAAEYDARALKHDAGFHWYGHPQIQYGMGEAHGRWLLAIGDDDELLPGAVEDIRGAIGELGEQPAPLLFRAVMKWGEILWHERQLAITRISAQNIVAPNVPDRLGHWATDIYAGDYVFIAETVEKWQREGVEPVWREEVIVQCH
jgi:hypothetical protein